MKLTIKHKTAILGYTLAILYLIIVCMAYNLFIAPHFGIKSISFNAFLWGGIIYVLQNMKGTNHSEKSDEDHEIIFKKGEENACGKVIAILVMMFLYYSNN
jgi:hypothetical protein